MLASLNLTSFPKIEVLICGYNSGLQLDTAKSATIAELYCDNCNLTYLDVTSLPALRVLVAGDNDFSPAFVSQLQVWGQKAGHTLSLDSSADA